MTAASPLLFCNSSLRPYVLAFPCHKEEALPQNRLSSSRSVLGPWAAHGILIGSMLHEAEQYNCRELIKFIKFKNVLYSSIVLLSFALNVVLSHSRRMKTQSNEHKPMWHATAMPKTMQGSFLSSARCAHATLQLTQFSSPTRIQVEICVFSRFSPRKPAFFNISAYSVIDVPALRFCVDARVACNRCARAK